MRPLAKPTQWICKCRHCRFWEPVYRRSIKRGEAQQSKKAIAREADHGQ